MLQLFRNNTPFTVLILFIITFILKLQALSHPVPPVMMSDHIAYGAILYVLGHIMKFGAFAYTILAVLMLFLQAMYINYLTAKHKLYNKITYFPALVYLLITSINPAFNYFSEPLLINWFLIWSLDYMFTLSQTLQPRKQIFNTGFVLCLPVLIQFPALGFLLLFFVALLLLRPFNISEWVVALLGYLTPIYFFAGVLFLADQLQLVVHFPQIGFALPRSLGRPVYMFCCISGTVLLLIAGLFGFQQHISKMTIYIRRNWYLVFLYLIVSTIVTIISLSPLNAEWLLVLPPLSIIVAHSFYVEKTKRFSNFIFYFSILFVILCQLAINK